ncbi:MAG: histidine kinase [Methylobacterium sp.]|uniref:histidine kinase n=1 Tax=Methylobacterium sp. TaxID=409 RepID=UPI0025F5F494|nr:histidine kinase [Methylobacterium sp.]MBX9932293.1 histidine kinase [Methylobacterium sp.]
MPTLFRFLATLAILGGLVFAGMVALATFVVPTPREMSVTIPASKLQPPPR